MITSDRIDEVTRLVIQEGLREETVSALRQRFPDLHFTWCMDDEVSGPAPVRELDGVNLYLVDGRSHCLCFTQDQEIATGLVLAEVTPA